MWEEQKQTIQRILEETKRMGVTNPVLDGCGFVPQIAFVFLTWKIMQSIRRLFHHAAGVSESAVQPTQTKC